MTNRTTEELLKDFYRILEAIKSSTGYFSAGYIARVTGLDIYEIEEVLSNKTKFRKSFIKGSTGQDIYLVNTRFSYLKDLWNFIRHRNALKY